MLPAVLYIPLLVASYFIFDLFHTETAEIPDKTLQTTEFLPSCLACSMASLIFPTVTVSLLGMMREQLYLGSLPLMLWGSKT